MSFPSNGKYHIVNVATSYRLDVAESNFTPGVRVIIWNANSPGLNQQWDLQWSGEHCTIRPVQAPQFSLAPVREENGALVTLSDQAAPWGMHGASQSGEFLIVSGATMLGLSSPSSDMATQVNLNQSSSDTRRAWRFERI